MPTIIDLILELDGIAFGLFLIAYLYKNFSQSGYPKKVLSINFGEPINFIIK